MIFVKTKMMSITLVLTKMENKLTVLLKCVVWNIILRKMKFVQLKGKLKI